jgi:hypothetical protein
MKSNSASRFTTRLKKSAIVALTVSAGYMVACPPLLAQTITDLAATSDQARLVGAAAQRDFSQFVQFSVQTRGGTLPSEFPLEVSDVQDLKDAKISYGFPVYSIPPQDIMNGRGDLRSMAKATGEWRFVITLHDSPIGMATLSQTNGRWGITSYGAAVLSKDVDASMAVHGNATRSNVRFIRVYQAMSDFLEVTSATDASTRFAPLHSARQSLLLQQRSEKTGSTSANNGLLAQGDFIDVLRASVKSNMDTSR